MKRNRYKWPLVKEEYLAWQLEVAEAILSPAGQAFMQELVKALDAIPRKELIAGRLADNRGGCCALGTVCRSRGLDVSQVDHDNLEDISRFLDIPCQIVDEVVYLNDAAYPGEAPTDRWARMRFWAGNQVNG
jgi:hypothetical protein